MQSYELVRLAHEPSFLARLFARLSNRPRRWPTGGEVADLPERGRGDEFVHAGRVWRVVAVDHVARPVRLLVEPARRTYGTTLLGRRGARFRLLAHDSALALVYGAVAAAWLAAAVIAPIGN